MCSDVLALSNFELDFKVTSDASDLGYEAAQEQEISQKNYSENFDFEIDLFIRTKK